VRGRRPVKAKAGPASSLTWKTGLTTTRRVAKEVDRLRQEVILAKANGTSIHEVGECSMSAMCRRSAKATLASKDKGKGFFPHEASALNENMACSVADYATFFALLRKGEKGDGGKEESHFSFRLAFFAFPICLFSHRKRGESEDEARGGEGKSC